MVFKKVLLPEFEDLRTNLGSFRSDFFSKHFFVILLIRTLLVLVIFRQNPLRHSLILLNPLFSQH